MRKLSDFADIMQNNKNKVAYKYFLDGQIVEQTYTDLSNNIKSVKSFLLENHKERNKISIISESSYHWITLCLGIYASNNIVVSIDYNLSQDEVKEILGYIGSNIIFISKMLYEKFKNIFDDTMSIYIIENVYEKIYNTKNDLTCNINSNDLAHLLFTSGTTSSKKGVMLSYSNIENTIFNNELKFDTRMMFSLLPMYHCFELFVGHLFRLYCGATIFINDNINNLMTNMQIIKPTFITIVPDLAIKLNNIIEKMGIEAFKQLTGGNLTTISLGGAPVNKNILENLRKHNIEVYNGYGLTETTSCCLATRPTNNVLGTVGAPLNENVHVKLAEDGEILISGKTIMMGYYKNEKATKETIIDGWLHTGDIGKEVENGNFIVIGRKINKIVFNNGKKVYPEEIEEKIKYIENVTNNLVYEKDNQLNLLIQIEKDENKIKESIKKEIDKFNENKVGYKKIYNIYFTTKQFPITTTKKVKRQFLLEHLCEYIEKKEIDKKEISKKIKEIGNINEELTFDTNIYDLGFDSLSTMELSCIFNCNPQDIYNNPTINKLYLFLNNKNEQIEEKIEINKYIDINKNLTKPFKEKSILLTGATGYLGSHILNELLNMDIDIYCLVRDKEKLKNIYNYYFNKKLPSKVKIIVGDIEKDMLGLTFEKYVKYIRKINCVIHTAANVSHIASYESMYKTNVIGTKNIIKFCKQSNSILHYMSTYSVSGLGLCNQTKKSIFDESILDIGQKYKDNVYVRTKYEAEVEILKSRFEDGLLANIYRIGSLTWDKYGKFQINPDDNGLIRKIRGIKKSNILTKEVFNSKIDFTNITDCTNAFIYLFEDKKINNIYNLYNHNLIKISDIVQGSNFKIVSKEKMKESINKINDKDIKFYYYYTTLLDEEISLEIKSDYTINKLSELGFSWSVPTKEYLSLINKF